MSGKRGVGPRALLFDVQGTATDFHSTVQAEACRISAGRHAGMDWGVFVNRWRAEYFAALTSMTRNENTPWVPVHSIYRNALEHLLVRRQVWQAARTLPDQRIAKAFRGARWALLKNPGDLTDTQAETLREMKHTGGILWRVYLLKESLREVFAGDLDPATAGELLDRWCSRAQRCRIPEFVKAARTIRKHRAGIDAAIDRGLSNGRHEGLNTKVRLLIRRAYGFHSAEAALALVMLACGPVKLELPYHTSRHPHSWQ